MKTYTPMETLSRIQGELWWTTRLLARAQAKFEERSDTRIQLGEVERVIRSMIEEVGRIIRESAGKAPNSRNLRQAEDFALKAQATKKDSVALEAVAPGRKLTS